MKADDVYRLPRLEVAKVIALALVQAITLGAFRLLARALFDAMAAGPVQHERVFTMIWWLAISMANDSGIEFFYQRRPVSP